GLFLLFKATVELHERLDSNENKKNENKNYESFWAVVIQIVILDAVFSLDAIITAVGMVNQLFIMMVSVILSTILMILASKKFTKFINLHQTVVVLCLSFLLMIGFSLVAESLRFYIPKGYLYAAIGFSILIEVFNQIARYNSLKHQSRQPMRQRIASIVLRLMLGEKNKKNQINNNINNNQKK
ncbi:MAG: TerC family protein, partial [Buchnera aphidicola]|nr:TerC family protein [Buchnera aphidicola]